MQVVMMIHDDLLLHHGGHPGVRDEGLLEAAIDRPRNRRGYGAAHDIFDLAACYGFGISDNHPFVDGNKRTAFQAMYTFLGLNGAELVADEMEVVSTMVDVAAGRVTEKRLAEWLRGNGTKRARRG